MPNYPSYVPAPRQPDDAESVIDTELLHPGRNQGRPRQIEKIRDQTWEDAVEIEGMRIKQGVASYVEARMTKTAASNIESSIDHLEDIRERGDRGSWAQKRIDRATDRLADDTERRQRGITEGASRQVGEVARRPITPKVDPPSFLQRLRGKD